MRSDADAVQLRDKPLGIEVCVGTDLFLMGIGAIRRQHLGSIPLSGALRFGDAASTSYAPLGSLGAKVALARRLGLIDEAVERSLQTPRRVRNAFAHSTASASLGDSAHAGRLAQAYEAARENPLWSPLATVLDRQPTNDGKHLDPALRDYILLITVLVAFLEATAQQLQPFQPQVVMGFSGLS
jgi:hypothetical protein